MIALKVLFLLMLAFPFAVFLLFMLDRLMDDLPKGKDISSEEAIERSIKERRRKTRKSKGKRSAAATRANNHNQKQPSKRQRRKARKQRKKMNS